MTNQIDHIVEHLFHKKRLDDVSVYELERFIATHPYFAAGHFLLAKKSQNDDRNVFKEKVATAALYYHNPLWLQWLLDQDYNGVQEQHQVMDTVVDRSGDAHDEEIANASTSVEQRDEKIVEQPFENVENDNVSHFYSSETSQEEISAAGAQANVETTSTEEEPIETFQQNDATDEETDTSAIPPETNFGSESDSSDQDMAPASEPREVREVDHTQNLDEVPASENLTNSDQPEVPAPESDQFEEPQFEHEPGMENKQPTEQYNSDGEESRASAASIEKTLTSAALIPTRAEIDKNEFTFEPYHTIDYFASQGIKLQQADLSKDKFGKQLKSFTEWLRSMKRLPQATTEGNLDDATQRSIQDIAEHSFEEKDIVTETMAEVWIKQGNKEKAIDTLHKLSLLNPSKSHYFAAKIEQLKAS